MAYSPDSRLISIIDTSLHSEREGTMVDAYEDVLQNGGQLFQGNGRESAHTVVRGKKTVVYWAKNSRKKAEVASLCRDMGIDPYALS